MKAYSLLYLSLFSFVTISACKPSRTAQTEKMKEMEKKELKMLENSQAKSEEEALEISFGPSHESLVNWVLSDTATFSYPFTRSIEKEYVTIATSADKCLRIYSWRRKGQHLPLLKRKLPLCGNHGRQSHPESTAQRKNHPATNARNERVLIRPLQTL